MASFRDFVQKRRGAPDPRQPTPATRALPSVPAQPRVLLVTTANLFVWDGSNRTVDMTKRPTGGLTLTHALTRHVHALGGSIVAVDFVRDDYDVAERLWEDIPIKCVRRDAAVSRLTADVVVTTSLALDVVKWASAHCEAQALAAMCHDYSGAPWGPFGHVDAKQRAPLRDALAGWNLLCDSKHVTAYHKRFGPANVTPRLCYGASYGYFRAPPLYRHAVAAEYVTFISPCAPKGLSILAAIAPRMPHVRFMCVATAWTNAVVQHILKRFPNVMVVAGAPDVDVFYRRTKVLLVPSIWPEALGWWPQRQPPEASPSFRRTLGVSRRRTLWNDCDFPRAGFMTTPHLSCCGAISTMRWSGPRPTRRRTSSTHRGTSAESASRSTCSTASCTWHRRTSQMRSSRRSRGFSRTTRFTPKPRATRARGRWRSSSGTTGRLWML